MAEMQTTPLRRWGPLLGLLAAITIAYALGLPSYLSPSWLAVELDLLQSFVAAHLLVAVMLFTVLYIAAVALSLPGAGLLSLSGGVIFGWKMSAPATVVGATLGSIIVFQVVKTSLGEHLSRKASPFVDKLAQGFKRDAFNYLLFLRLAPIFPFFAVNIVAGMFRVDIKTFAITTFLGIIPGSLAFSWIGSGAGTLVTEQAKLYRECMASNQADACSLNLPLSSLVSPELIAGLSVLAVTALLPLLYRWLKGAENV